MRPTDDSRSVYFAELDQSVMVRAVSVSERPWLLVYAEVCSVARYESKTAVAHAATLAVGGLCVFDDRYFLHHSLPRSTPRADLDAALFLVAHEAARLRESTAAEYEQRDVSPFVYYAE